MLLKKIEKGKKVELLMKDIPTFTPEEKDAIDLLQREKFLMERNMPTPSDYLSVKQKNGILLRAG